MKIIHNRELLCCSCDKHTQIQLSTFTSIVILTSAKGFGLKQPEQALLNNSSKVFEVFCPFFVLWRSSPHSW